MESPSLEENGMMIVPECGKPVFLPVTSLPGGKSNPQPGT
jgi:hypothetical protein